VVGSMWVNQGLPVWLALCAAVLTGVLIGLTYSVLFTRAEASDVAAAVFEGADAVMLSGETAAGQYPAEAVAMMDRIVARVEADRGWRDTMDAGRPVTYDSVSAAIAAAASQIARGIGARAIVALTSSGLTALRIARERPNQPVLAMATELAVARRLALAWGVHAVHTQDARTMTEAVARATKLARDEGLARGGDTVVVAAGIPFGQTGTTNSLRVAAVK